MTDEKRCPGCYKGWSGWWCDNCDEWPCTCDGGPDETQTVPTVPVHESEDESW